MVYLHLFVNGTILLHRPGFCNRSFPTQYNKNFFLLFSGNWCILSKHHAGVMELVDVVDSKSTGGDTVPVRARPPAPNKKRKASAFLFLFYGGRARTHLNATLRGSVAREGLTERNNNFCPKGTKMQIEPGHRRLRSKSSPASQHHTFSAPSSYWENAQKTMSSFVGYSAFTAEYAK